MPVEGPIVDLSSLNEAWPLDDDSRTESDDQLRLTKDAIIKSFTDISTNGGAVTITAAEFNAMQGVTSGVQGQIDAIVTPWRYVDSPTLVLTSKDRLYCNPPAGGTVVTFPDTPPQGTEILVIDVSGLSAPPNNTVVLQRSGSNTFTDLDTGASGQTSVTMSADSQILTFIHFTGIWYYFGSAMP